MDIKNHPYVQGKCMKKANQLCAPTVLTNQALSYVQSGQTCRRARPSTGYHSQDLHTEKYKYTYDYQYYTLAGC